MYEDDTGNDGQRREFQQEDDLRLQDAHCPLPGRWLVKGQLL